MQVYLAKKSSRCANAFECLLIFSFHIKGKSFHTDSKEFLWIHARTRRPRINYARFSWQFVYAYRMNHDQQESLRIEENVLCDLSIMDDPSQVTQDFAATKYSLSLITAILVNRKFRIAVPKLEYSLLC